MSIDDDVEAMRDMVLIVGMGKIGQRHKENAEELGFSVQGIDVGDSLQEAMDDKPLFAIVATPPADHVKTCFRLAENDIPTFVEKPPALCLEDMKRLCFTFNSRGIPLGVGYQMMRINSLDKLLRKIKNFMRRKSVDLDGDVCLICKETDETVTLKFHNGDVQISNEQLPETVILTRRQLVQLIFGPYPKAEPVKFDAKTAEILERIFPFYFPIWELDHC